MKYEEWSTCADEAIAGVACLAVTRVAELARQRGAVSTEGKLGITVDRAHLTALIEVYNTLRSMLTGHRAQTAVWSSIDQTDNTVTAIRKTKIGTKKQFYRQTVHV